MKNVSSGGLIALLALALPASAGTPNTEPNCKKERCTVTVMVNGNTCGGGIAISPDPVITKVGTGPVTITWKVVGDWEFDAKGIDIVEPGDTFKVGAKDKDTWQALNAANAMAIWRYDVNLVRKGKASEKCTRDPTIINH